MLLPAIMAIVSFSAFMQKPHILNFLIENDKFV